MLEVQIQIPVRVPKKLLEAARKPEVIDDLITETERKSAARKRSIAISRIGCFLLKNGVVPPSNSGGGDYSSTIAYLDSYYPGWRGYEVRYVDGRVG